MRKKLLFKNYYYNANSLLVRLLPFAYAEAYDKMQGDLTKAKENLTKILTSKDVKATVVNVY